MQRLITIIAIVAMFSASAIAQDVPAWRSAYDDAQALFNDGDYVGTLDRINDVTDQDWATAETPMRVERLGMQAQSFARINSLAQATAAADKAVSVAMADTTQWRSDYIVAALIHKCAIKGIAGDWVGYAAESIAAAQVAEANDAKPYHVDRFRFMPISGYYNAGDDDRTIETAASVIPALTSFYVPISNFIAGDAAARKQDVDTARGFYMAGLESMAAYPLAWPNTLKYPDYVGTAVDYLISTGSTPGDLEGAFIAFVSSRDDLGLPESWARVHIPATSPNRLLVSDAGELLADLKAYQLAAEHRVNVAQLRLLSDRLADGGNGQGPLKVSADEQRIGAAITGPMAGYYGELFKGNASAAAIFAFERFAKADTDAEYARWAEQGVAPALRVLDQCMNCRALEFLQWSVGDSDVNPIDGLRR